MAKLYIKNIDGTYSPYQPVAVSNLDIVQETGGSLTSAMSQKAVTDELTKKQDTINDLADIRSGAAKGATALQSETDPVYLADKPSLALKTEIPDVSGKADKATTLSGYGIGDAYTKSEVDAAIASAITITLNTEV